LRIREIVSGEVARLIDGTVNRARGVWRTMGKLAIISDVFQGARLSITALGTEALYVGARSL
jgi:hypothetical protein